MCRRFCYLVSFVVVLGLVGSAAGQDGTGLRAEYYHWTGSSPPDRDTVAFIDLVVTRIEPQIYCYWNPGFQAVHPDGLTPNFEIEPPAGVRADTFAVRWEGYIKAVYSEAYTFITGSDDGVRLWVNDQLLIDSWVDQDRAENTSDPIQLVAGQKYPILVEGYENGGEAEWQLYWQSTSTPREVVPQRVLYPLVKPVDFLPQDPDPADGAVLGGAWTRLTWTPGVAAVSHDVYFGESFDDVSQATPASDMFRANMPEPWYLVGFPGYPYSTGLTPGTTYYWRVDEVNDAHPDSPWRGPVWSFMLPPLNAWNPYPADGMKFVDPNADLTWRAGWASALHFVFFGEDFDEVNEAVVGTPRAATTYDPGTLEFEKTYYWRVDEFDGTTTTRGDVWTFTVAREGGGLKGQYYHWPGGAAPDPPASAFRLLRLTRIDAGIDFGWGAASPEPGTVNADAFAVIWTGEVEAAFSDPYTFYTVTDDGVMLWVDDKLIIDNWTVHSDTENASEPIELVAGQRYPIQMWYFENDGSATARLLWESPRQPKEAVPAGALSPPVRAYGPRPGNGAVNVTQTPTLTWNAGDKAAQHKVYFGSAPDALSQVATKTVGDESHGPLGPLEWNKTYYWRVDEVNNLEPDSPWIGSVWSFTVANFLIVDDFESYTDDIDNRIFQTWIDGWGYTEPEVVLGNGSGSTVGHLTPPFAEQTIINSGRQSMPFDYNNTGAGGKFFYSEAERTWDSPQNWTREGVKALTLYFRGYPPIFVEDPPGTYTISANGVDIWGASDEFRYVYKRLSGNGEIVARVVSIGGPGTNEWRKAGVMIRQTLDPTSFHAFMAVTPTASHGLAFQYRDVADDSDSEHGVDNQTVPYWVKLVRQGDQFTGYHSPDGVTWTAKDASGDEADGMNPVTIAMPANVYIGLALTSHDDTDTGIMCVAEFSNVSTTGSVTGNWQVADIGVEQPGNEAEQLYIAVEDSANNVKVINHTDSRATTLDTWQEWNTDLRDITGVNLTAVKKMYIGVGDRDAPQRGGAGTLYFDDIRLYKPRCVASIIKPDADLSGNCVVDLADIEILASQWLQSGAGLTADLYEDETIDLKDLAEIGEAWLEQQLWPQP
jgi:hypothetical protein